MADPDPAPRSDPDSTTSAADRASSLESELDRLQLESRRRQAELREIATALPKATSRRTVVAEMVRSVRDAPDRAGVAKRVVIKLVRTPADVVRRLR